MAKQINIKGTDALLIGGGVIAFFAIKKLLIKFGIASGPGTQQTINELTNPGSPWKPEYWKKGSGALLIKNAVADKYATTIHNAFTVFQDDFNAIVSVFSQLKTKSQVSYLAQKFAEKYNEDLLQFLTNGGGILPWDGLSDSQLLQITNYVNKLPAFSK